MLVFHNISFNNIVLDVIVLIGKSSVFHKTWVSYFYCTKFNKHEMNALEGITSYAIFSYNLI